MLLILVLAPGATAQVTYDFPPEEADQEELIEHLNEALDTEPGYISDQSGGPARVEAISDLRFRIRWETSGNGAGPRSHMVVQDAESKSGDNYLVRPSQLHTGMEFGGRAGAARVVFGPEDRPAGHTEAARELIAKRLGIEKAPSEVWSQEERLWTLYAGNLHFPPHFILDCTCVTHLLAAPLYDANLNTLHIVTDEEGDVLIVQLSHWVDWNRTKLLEPADAEDRMKTQVRPGEDPFTSAKLQGIGHVVPERRLVYTWVLGYDDEHLLVDQDAMTGEVLRTYHVQPNKADVSDAPGAAPTALVILATAHVIGRRRSYRHTGDRRAE